MNTTSADLLLEVENLVVSYPISQGFMSAIARRPKKEIRAVDGVGLKLCRGEMLALVGESGCGKTSTALALLRLVTATSGTIRFQGRDLSALSPSAMRSMRRRMQIIYQDPYESLDPRFRIEQIVEEPLLVHRIGRSDSDRQRLVLEALERTGLTPPDLYLKQYPHELSGGQRQRVAIAASLAVNPDLLVADEPVSMLDVSVRAGVLSVLDNLRRSGLGILMITHDLSTAAHYADRIAVMYLGRIVEEGPTNEIIRNPKHPYTRALLAVVPNPDPRAGGRPQILHGETPNPSDIPTGCRFKSRCPVARDECATVDPELHPARNGGSQDHRAACILV